MTPKTLIPLAVVLAAALALPGCQSTCTGDPRTDGLYCAQRGLSSGLYAQNTEQLRIAADSRLLEASRSASRAEAARRAAAADRRRASRIQAELDAQAAEIDRLRDDLARAEARLSELRTGGTSEQIAREEAEVARIRRQIAAMRR